MAQDKKNITNRNLIYRIYTAVLLIPIYYFTIISNNYLASMIIILTSFILAFEWFNITQNTKKKEFFFFYFFLVFFNLFLSLFFNFFSSIISTILISVIFFLKYIFKDLTRNNLKWLFYGFIFISLPIIIFFNLKKLDNGSFLLIWLFVSICFTDIFSYTFGKLIKGPKIFPVLSPSKTYSGTILGITTGSLIGAIFSLIYLNINNIFNAIFLSLLICVSGLIGDLFVSYTKRQFHTKDSGNILPGHGGLLDRYDSISFGLIMLFFLKYFF